MKSQWEVTCSWVFVYISEMVSFLYIWIMKLNDIFHFWSQKENWYLWQQKSWSVGPDRFFMWQKWQPSLLSNTLLSCHLLCQIYNFKEKDRSAIKLYIRESLDKVLVTCLLVRCLIYKRAWTSVPKSWLDSEKMSALIMKLMCFSQKWLKLYMWVIFFLFLIQCIIKI